MEHRKRILRIRLKTDSRRSKVKSNCVKYKKRRKRRKIFRKYLEKKTALRTQNALSRLN